MHIVFCSRHAFYTVIQVPAGDFQSVIKRRSICNLMEVFWIRIGVLFRWPIYPFFVRIFRRREFVIIKIPPAVRYSRNMFAEEENFIIAFRCNHVPHIRRLDIIILVPLIGLSIHYMYTYAFFNIELYRMTIVNMENI